MSFSLLRLSIADCRSSSYKSIYSAYFWAYLLFFRIIDLNRQLLSSLLLQVNLDLLENLLLLYLARLDGLNFASQRSQDWLRLSSYTVFSLLFAFIDKEIINLDCQLAHIWQFIKGKTSIAAPMMVLARGQGHMTLVSSGSFYYVNSCYFPKQSSVSKMMPKSIHLSLIARFRLALMPHRAFPLYNHFQYTMARGTTVFLVFAIIWQIGVGVLYGFFFSYNDSAFVQMDTVTSVFHYNYTLDARTVFRTNTSQYPYPQAVVAIAMILIVVGLALIAGYIERSSLTGVAFTLLIFAMTIQNFFIFRGLLNRVGLNGNSGTGFFPFSYPQINYINFGNDLQSQKDTYALPSASFLDAVGASLAIYAGYTAVVGRISLGEVFFLSWFGTLFYQINSQILWRIFVPDNGYPSRAFAYGGTLGLISSLLISKRKETKNHPAYKSSSRTMAVAFLGTVLVWCSYPILVLSSVYTSTTGKVVSMAGQVNIWLALAAGVVGCYAASSLSYRRFCLHDFIFTSLTGGIAFSSSTDINYNPGAATAIGFMVGLFMSLLHTSSKRKINSRGVIDSNSAIFHFLLPSFIACISSAVLQGVGQSAASYNVASISSANITSNNTVLYSQLLAQGRSVSMQGGFQVYGWMISVAFGAAAGGIIGLIYRSSNDNFKEIDKFFNDATLYDFPIINLKDSAMAPVQSVYLPQANSQQQAIRENQERVQPLPEIVPQQDQAADEQHKENTQDKKEGQEIENREEYVEPQPAMDPKQNSQRIAIELPIQS